MKNLCILGATGSIGRQTLEIAEKFPKQFTVEAVCANKNIIALSKIIAQFSPKLAVVGNQQAASKLKALLPKPLTTKILYGEEGLSEAVALDSVNLVVNAIVGSAGLFPTWAAITAGKNVALANKETLVAGGELIMAEAKANNVKIIPIDSEHSAIFQCLMGENNKSVAKLIITGSGGPFRTLAAAELNNVTKQAALKHPNWEMGPKITIDSATLMNKGLEVIEACWLFDLPPEKIEVVLHPQSIVHSMAVFNDGSVKAQLGKPDMRPAIAYALTYPERLNLKLPAPDFAGGLELNFSKPDTDKFPCFNLALEAAKTGGTMPAVMNAANEMAVNAFLQDEIGFMDIPALIEAVMSRHTVDANHALTLGDVRDADAWARETAKYLLGD